jgi:CubicO group peptidase (beta-lactamase class C family)
VKKLATAACAILLASAWLYSTEQWRYFYRVYSYPTQPITDFEWYDSLAIVDGRSDAARTATASVVVRREALKAAVDYVRKTPRSSVVVLHRGQLLLESYPQKQNAERLTNSMSMAKSIIALLIGIAIEEGAINSVEDSVALYLPRAFFAFLGTLILRIN